MIGTEQHSDFDSQNDVLPDTLGQTSPCCPTKARPLDHSILEMHQNNGDSLIVDQRTLPVNCGDSFSTTSLTASKYQVPA